MQEVKMQTDPKITAVEPAQVAIALEPVAVPIEMAPAVSGANRTRIFRAVADKELTARKLGKATIIELCELRRWIKSLPTRGREPDRRQSGSDLINHTIF